MRHRGWLIRVLIGMLIGVMAAAAAPAQEAWVQIEAQPTLREAENRAQAYAGVFPDVAGFAMTTGWYAIVLGPYPPAEAERRLGLLKGEGMIPADSY
ncbi:MAG: SPOR domain-containing protein, partial [Erythrobacter sp.]|nr:SPOR domain-containing protein [Erythrobacter sp.]